MWGMGPAIDEQLDTGVGTGIGRAWNVIVLNDHHNTFEGVALALADVLPGVTYATGLQIAGGIHHAGRAIVWSGGRVEAEEYWEGLQGYGLTMAPLEA